MSSDRERRNQRAIDQWERKNSSPPDEVEADECDTCEGTGKIAIGESISEIEFDTCEDCEGFGEIPRGGRDQEDDGKADYMYDRMRDLKLERGE